METEIVEQPKLSLVLSADDLAALSACLGQNINSVDQLVKRVKRMSTLWVAGHPVQFKPATLDRLKSRCLHQNFPKWVAERVVEWANAYVGL